MDAAVILLGYPFWLIALIARQGVIQCVPHVRGLARLPVAVCHAIRHAFDIPEPTQVIVWVLALVIVDPHSNHHRKLGIVRCVCAGFYAHKLNGPIRACRQTRDNASSAIGPFVLVRGQNLDDLVERFHTET